MCGISIWSTTCRISIWVDNVYLVQQNVESVPDQQYVESVCGSTTRGISIWSKTCRIQYLGQHKVWNQLSGQQHVESVFGSTTWNQYLGQPHVESVSGSTMYASGLKSVSGSTTLRQHAESVSGSTMHVSGLKSVSGSTTLGTRV